MNKTNAAPDMGDAQQTRDDVALWANIALFNLWGAVGYLKPGWLPATLGVTVLQ